MYPILEKNAFMIPYLPKEPVGFPPVDTALTDPDGLLVAGGALTPSWLLTAYYHGIFPWFSDGEPIMWWSPNPRWVITPASLRVNRTLRKLLAKRPYQVTANQCFEQVIEACASQPRPGQQGTWITDEMQQAYCHLHKLGFAHSIEVWHNGNLVGGLYGIALGQVFFGESMFSLAPSASKVALVALAKQSWVKLIDCQAHTPHTESLGALAVARSNFCATLEDLIELPLTPTAVKFADENSLNRATSL